MAVVVNMILTDDHQNNYSSNHEADGHHEEDLCARRTARIAFKVVEIFQSSAHAAFTICHLHPEDWKITSLII